MYWVKLGIVLCCAMPIGILIGLALSRAIHYSEPEIATTIDLGDTICCLRKGETADIYLPDGSVVVVTHYAKPLKRLVTQTSNLNSPIKGGENRRGH